MTEQNKDGKAKCGCAVLEGRSSWTGKWCLLLRNPRQASLTRDILLRDVKLFSYFISQCLQANGFVHILLRNLNDRCRVFFSLQHFSYCVDSKMLNEFCILTDE